MRVRRAATCRGARQSPCRRAHTAARPPMRRARATRAARSRGRRGSAARPGELRIMLVRAAVAAAATLAAAVGAGCGGGDPAALPPACSNGPDTILRALERAPGEVRLEDGTRVSECVEHAFDDGELQQLGTSLTPAADTLAARGTPTAALQLGYLIGAVRRGAGRTNGIHAELVRHLEGTAPARDPALVAATRRGIAAGEARG